WPGFDVQTFAHSSVVGPTASSGVAAQARTFSVNDAYPNPFTSKTQIHFSLGAASSVVLTVEDILGRSVHVLANGRYGAGEHDVVFDAGNLPAGVYRYTLRANGESVSRSMSLLK